MDNSIYKDWISIYNEEIEKSCKNERRELQKAVMLITALRFELDDVQQILEQRLLKLRKQLEEEDRLKQKIGLENKTLSESRSLLRLDVTCANNHDADSPDMFKVSDVPSTPENSFSFDLTNFKTSPTLISKRSKRSKKNRSNSPEKRNILQDNSIIIDCTPELESNKEKLAKKRIKYRNVKKKKGTLTQLFSKVSTADITKKENVPKIVISPNNNETTYLKQDTTDNSELGITQMLSMINKSSNSVNEDNDSSQELDEFSKGMLFDETAIGDISSPKKKLKLKHEYNVEPVVRGNARKLLNGFSCNECKKFYATMDLSPTELQKQMDQCSRHRYKYKPPEDTLPGIWDLTIPENGN